MISTEMEKFILKKRGYTISINKGEYYVATVQAKWIPETEIVFKVSSIDIITSKTVNYISTENGRIHIINENKTVGTHHFWYNGMINMSDIKYIRKAYSNEERSLKIDLITKIK
jgi:hypothetical protein